ncbi:MAG TPA: sigma-54 dependent transcriptional regulator [Dissulfurispiraceae bacterium]|nr:sigma-54 dependent transcriptional regulator [Dissulfurispiraceae bacterium]
MKSVLIVDDEIDMATALKETMKRFGFNPTVYHNPVDVLAKENIADYALVITDMKMPKMNGIEFLQEIRNRGLFVPVIMITGFGTVESAVDAMKLGATDYIMKPVSFDSLKRTIDRIIPVEYGDFVAESPVMKNLMSIIKEVAKSDITILLTGESGTGKEIIARTVHKYSNRNLKPFVAVNCAAISESLLESELFGHEKGAFTGAVERRLGKFELANGGTLLLDEISEMAYSLQAKLLRAIQEREIDRIGGKGPVRLDVRIIATTNKDLMSEVKKGNFREDLYYRLNVFPVRIPPLAERKEDVIPLAEFFLQRLSQKMGKIFTISEAFRQYLLGKEWAGNVRELENFMYRTAVISASDVLAPPEEGPALSGGQQQPAAAARTGSLKDVERDLIIKTLIETGNNRTKAAAVLGVSVRTIRNKLKDYNITDDELKGT